MSPIDMYVATSQPQLMHIIIVGVIALALLLNRF
jgi:hypothetical protein